MHGQNNIKTVFQLWRS